MKTSSTILFSLVLHAAIAAAVLHVRAPAPPRGSSIEVEVSDTPPPAHTPKPATPAPSHAPPPPLLKHAPPRAVAPPRAEPPPSAEPPPPAPPLQTGVELGNGPAGNGAAVGTRAPPPPTVKAPPPRAVQKELSARPRPPAEDGCSEPPSKPSPLSKPSLIEYTPKARADGIEGRLVLRVTVGPHGTVDTVTVDSPVEPTLDEAAMATVRGWTFAPALRCGKPVSGTYVVARRFEQGD